MYCDIIIGGGEVIFVVVCLVVSVVVLHPRCAQWVVVFLPGVLVTLLHGRVLRRGILRRGMLTSIRFATIICVTFIVAICMSVIVIFSWSVQIVTSLYSLENMLLNVRVKRWDVRLPISPSASIRWDKPVRMDILTCRFSELQ